MMVLTARKIETTCGTHYLVEKSDSHIARVMFKDSLIREYGHRLYELLEEHRMAQSPNYYKNGQQVLELGL